VSDLLGSGTEALSLIAPEWRPFIVLLFAGIGYRVAKKRGWVNGDHSLTQAEIQNLLAPAIVRISAVEIEVGTRLPKILAELRMDLQGDIAATQELAASVRDTTEQLNRNVNTSVVVLTKIDALRDVLIGLDAKIGTMGK
jgi:hypothetical protein